eukprot:gene7597-5358_t
MEWEQTNKKEKRMNEVLRAFTPPCVHGVLLSKVRALDQPPPQSPSLPPFYGALTRLCQPSLATNGTHTNCPAKKHKTEYIHIYIHTYIYICISNRLLSPFPSSFSFSAQAKPAALERGDREILVMVWYGSFSVVLHMLFV